MTTAILVKNLFAVGALMACWWFVVQPTLRDAYRQYLFGVRDRLFDMMARRQVTNSPAYKLIRAIINAQLRGANRLYFFEVVHEIAVLRAANETGLADVLHRELSLLPEDERACLRKSIDDTRHAMFLFMATTSAVSLVLTLGLFVWMLAKHRVERVEKELISGLRYDNEVAQCLA